MEVKIIISGVPYGEDSWGVGEHRSYIGTLYSSTDNVEKKFDIRINNTNGKRYIYYHYYVCNVNDSKSRNGSYFCITLCSDVFIKDFKTIYSVLDILFRKKIVGTVLQVVAQGTRYQYLCASFSEKDQKLKEIETLAYNIIGQNLSNNDISEIPSVSQGQRIRYNEEDVTEEDFVKSIKTNGNCSISPQYPRTRDIEWEKKVMAVEQRTKMLRQKEIDELIEKNKNKDKERNTINQEKNKLEQEKHDLQNEINSLKNKVASLQGARSVQENVKPIVEPITRLADYFKSQQMIAHVDRNANKKKTTLRGCMPTITGMLISCSVVFLLIWCMIKINDVNKTVNDIGDRFENYIIEQTDSVALEEEVSSDSVSDKKIESNVKINIIELKSANEKLKKDKAYSYKIENNSNNNSVVISGAQHDDEKQKFTPIENEVIITVRDANGNDIASRKLEAE